MLLDMFRESESSSNNRPNTTRWPETACAAIRSSWWWTQWCPKHVEQRNKIFYEFKTNVHLVGFCPILSLMMHGTMNGKVHMNDRKFHSISVFLRNILYNFEYTAFLLSVPRARQVYRTESLHPPGYPITAAVFRAKVKETRYMSWFLLSAKRRSCCQLYVFIIPRVTICVAPIGPSVTMLNLFPNKSTVIQNMYF
jgi:hypothetical protein